MQIDMRPNTEYFGKQLPLSQEIFHLALLAKILNCRASIDCKWLAYRQENLKNPIVVKLDKPDFKIELTDMPKQGDTLRWSSGHNLLASGGNSLVLWNI
jgi:hypothetical protein